MAIAKRLLAASFAARKLTGIGAGATVEISGQLSIEIKLMKTIIIAATAAIALISPVIVTAPTRAEIYAQATDITAVGEGRSVFINNDWEVTIGKNGNRYTYASRQTGKPGIGLSGGRLSRSGGKHYYTWNNRGTVYQVTWQPQDPNYARVRVLDPRGREIFNKLMWTPPEI